MSFSPWRHWPAIFWKRRPVHLTVFVTRRCNARCPFCFYLSRPRTSDPAPELSATELEQVARSAGPLLWLALSGGEIFLRPDLPEIVGHFYRHCRPAIILLPTNGLDPEGIPAQVEAILAACPESTVVVKLSLDGPAELHDRLRGRPGALARVLATGQALAPLLDRYPHFELGVNTVFCRDNQEELAPVFDLVRGLPWVRTHTVSLVRGDTARPELKEVDLDRYQATVEWLEAEARQGEARRYRFGGAGLKAAQDLLQRRLILATARQQQRLIPCYAGRLNLVLTETGMLFPCEAFHLPMGNIRETGGDLRPLLAAPRARRVLAAIDHGGCHCTHECYFLTNILFNPRLYPQLLKEYLATGGWGRRREGQG
ncbi:MAG: radical SAM protein [Thermodesulfobacteriota bacterium]